MWAGRPPSLSLSLSLLPANRPSLHRPINLHLPLFRLHRSSSVSLSPQLRLTLTLTLPLPPLLRPRPRWGLDGLAPAEGGEAGEGEGEVEGFVGCVRIDVKFGGRGGGGGDEGDGGFEVLLYIYVDQEFTFVRELNGTEQNR